MNVQDVTYRDRIKYAVVFWGITLVAAFYLIPLVILAYGNPFVFRHKFMRWTQDQIRTISTWRSLQVKPIVDKYKTFVILKTA